MLIKKKCKGKVSFDDVVRMHKSINGSDSLVLPYFTTKIFIYTDVWTITVRLLFACSIVILLSRESDDGAIRTIIRTRLEVVHFWVFRLFLWLLATEFAACSKPPSRDNHRKVHYPRTQERVRWGWKLNLDHAIVITRSP